MARVELLEKTLRERLRGALTAERDGALASARKVRDEVRRLERALRNPERREDPKFLASARGRAERAVTEVVEAKQKAQQAAAGPAPESGSLRVGQKVFVVSLGVEAELVSGPDARGRCEVRAGILNMTVSKDELRHGSKTSAPKPKAPSMKREAAPARPSWDTAAPQATHNTVDVRGHRVEEALEQVERFLDASYKRDEQSAFIIHGHGTNALKKAVRAFLKDSQYVADQRPGARHEGGDGVTAVLLR